MKKSWDSSNFTRKEFMRISWVFLLIPLFWLWYSIVKKQQSGAAQYEEIKVASDLPLGISFFDRVIAVKDVKGVVFLSSRCTHLGCKIKTSENNVLICPCHGSRFSPEGQNLMGPASRPLAILSSRTDRKTGEFIVKLPEE
jgi:Rieske Fe-S protein